MILFITRKFPPMIGGMENFSAGLCSILAEQCDLVALKRGQKHLIWWVPLAIVRGMIKARQAAVVHIGDGVLAWVGVIINKFSHKPISITVHGLDLTYHKYWYQKFIWPALKHYDKIVCVSNYTAAILKQHGISESLIKVIPNAVFMEEWDIEKDRMAVRKLIDIGNNTDKYIMLTVGRLVKRKGVRWFVDQVMPILPAEIIYLIVGSGPDYDAIQEEIQKHDLKNKVFLLGRVSDEELHQLYGGADLFLMPNIPIKNDMEGFGIVALEAAAAGLPVLVSDIEGMRDAVVDGRTGYLVESSNVQAWKQAINRIRQSSSFSADQVKATVKASYSWQTVGDQYVKLFNKLS